MATFGNALATTNARGLSGGIYRGARITSWPATGTVQTITFVLEADVSGNWQAGIMNSLTGALIAQSAVRADISGARAARTFTFSNPSISEGADVTVFVAQEGGAFPAVCYSDDAQTYQGRSSDNFFDVDPLSASGITMENAAEDYCFEIDWTPTGGAPAVDDVDEDNTVTSTQTNVEIDGTDFDSASVEIRQGSEVVAQSVDSQDADTIQFDVVFDDGAGPHLKYGSATLAVVNGDDQEATIGITVAVPSGRAFVDIDMPNPTADNRITAVDDLATGDQLEISNVIGGAVADVTVYDDGTFSCDEAVESFDVRAWDAGDSTWGNIATQLVGDPPEPPVFDGTIPNQEYTEDEAITPLDASLYFTGATSYSVAGSLPAGLSFNTGTGELTGTPTEAGTFTGISITGTNSGGSDISNTFTISVASDAEFASGGGRKRDARRRGMLTIGGRG